MASSGKEISRAKGVELTLERNLAEDLRGLFERLAVEPGPQNAVDLLRECQIRSLAYMKRKSQGRVTRAENSDAAFKELRQTLDAEFDRALGIIDERYGGYVSSRLEILDQHRAQKGNDPLNDGFLILATCEVDGRWLIFDESSAELVSSPAAMALELDFRSGSEKSMIALPDSTLSAMIGDVSRSFATCEYDDCSESPFLSLMLRIIKRDAKLSRIPTIESCKKVGTYTAQLVTDFGYFRVQFRSSRPFLEGVAIREA